MAELVKAVIALTSDSHEPVRISEVARYLGKGNWKRNSAVYHRVDVAVSVGYLIKSKAKDSNILMVYPTTKGFGYAGGRIKQEVKPLVKEVDSYRLTYKQAYLMWK